MPRKTASKKTSGSSFMPKRSSLIPGPRSRTSRKKVERAVLSRYSVKTTSQCEEIISSLTVSERRLTPTTLISECFLRSRAKVSRSNRFSVRRYTLTCGEDLRSSGCPIDTLNSIQPFERAEHQARGRGCAARTSPNWQQESSSWLSRCQLSLYTFRECRLL